MSATSSHSRICGSRHAVGRQSVCRKPSVRRGSAGRLRLARRARRQRVTKQPPVLTVRPRLPIGRRHPARTRHPSRLVRLRAPRSRSGSVGCAGVASGSGCAGAVSGSVGCADVGFGVGFGRLGRAVSGSVGCADVASVLGLRWCGIGLGRLGRCGFGARVAPVRCRARSLALVWLRARAGLVGCRARSAALVRHRPRAAPVWLRSRAAPVRHRLRARSTPRRAGSSRVGLSRLDRSGFGNGRGSGGVGLGRCDSDSGAGAACRCGRSRRGSPVRLQARWARRLPIRLPAESLWPPEITPSPWPRAVLPLACGPASARPLGGAALGIGAAGRPQRLGLVASRRGSRRRAARRSAGAPGRGAAWSHADRR